MARINIALACSLALALLLASTQPGQSQLLGGLLGGGGGSSSSSSGSGSGSSSSSGSGLLGGLINGIGSLLNPSGSSGSGASNNALIQTLNGTVQNVEGLLNQLTQALNLNGDGSSSGLLDLSLGGLLDGITNGVSSFVSRLNSQLSQMLNAGPVDAGLLDGIGYLLKPVLELVNQLVNALTAVLRPLGVDVAPNAVRSLLNSVGIMTQGSLNGINTLLENGLPQLTTGGNSTGLVGSLLGLVSTLLENVVDNVESLVDVALIQDDGSNGNGNGTDALNNLFSNSSSNGGSSSSSSSSSIAPTIDLDRTMRLLQNIDTSSMSANNTQAVEGLIDRIQELRSNLTSKGVNVNGSINVNESS